MPRGRRCEAHAHEYLVPEEYHHLQPQSRGGPSVPDNMVWLCANAHGDVHFYLSQVEKYAKAGPGPVPWSIAQHYGPAVRALAMAGWARYADDFRAGRYDRHAFLWETSGASLRGGLSYADAARRGEVAEWLGLAGLALAGARTLRDPA